MKMLMQQQQGLHKHSVNTEYLYTYFFPEADICIYSEESRQKSERENLAHLGTIRISFKDS